MTEIVLFGITGDLARQKLIPSLYNLYSSGSLKPDTCFFGFGRKRLRDEEFHEFLETCVRSKSAQSTDLRLVEMLHQFIHQWTYITSELDTDAGYEELASKLTSDTSVVFLSLPPSLQMLVCSKLIENKVVERRVIHDSLISSAVRSVSANAPGMFGRKIALEKPYGHDAASARELEAYLSERLDQSQIMRVDHYAGKQALVELEAAARQGIFKNLLDRKSLKRIDVVMTETLDVSSRGAFYDSVGAMNDTLQNHMLHMLATVLALPEVSASSTGAGKASSAAIAAARARALESLEITGIPVLGQYSDYASTSGVAADTRTETFFNIEARVGKASQDALKVSFVGGKALKKAEGSVTVTFKNGKQMRVLVNGYGAKEAHEQIFEDAVAGNLDRFISYKQVIAGWRIVDSARKKHAGKKIAVYKKGTDASKIR